MSELFQNVLTASFHGSIVILAVIVLRLVLKKTPKKFICLLWMLAGIRLLMPFEIQSSLSLQPDTSSVAEQQVQQWTPEPEILTFLEEEPVTAGEDTQVIHNDTPAARIPGSSAAADAYVPAQVSERSDDAAADKTEPAVNWAALVPYFWLAVACCFGLSSVYSYLRLKYQVREAIKIPGGWESERIETAFILGFIRPQIYIPMGMSPSNRKYILAHERTHLEKGDHWFKMIGYIALAIHWFNPLVWVAYVLLCKDIEIACDERVVQFMELEERKRYSAALLSCSTNRAHYAACPVAFGEVSVKERIKSVLNYRKPSFWISLLGVIAIVFVAVCLVTNPKDEQTPTAGETTAELSEEQKILQRCKDALDTLLAQDSYTLDATGMNEYIVWQTRLVKQGGNTMWDYHLASSADPTNGRMEYNGVHYAYYNGSWMVTDTADTEFEGWLDIFRWDMKGAALVEEKQTEYGEEIIFTTQWQKDASAVYTATQHYFFDQDGVLTQIRVQNVNNALAQNVYLTNMASWEEKTAGDYFAEAAARIAEGEVSAEDLTVQAELDAWGVLFRVDDDRLSDSGSDVYISQDETGRGVLYTTEEYWIERKTGDGWEVVTPISQPQWSDDSIGIAKQIATYGYLDWTPIYGKLPTGTYRMGKNVTCYDESEHYKKTQAFYSEFEIYSVVDSNSPEAAAAVERCYTALDALKNREYVHYFSQMGDGDYTEAWINGQDFLRLYHWDTPNGVSVEELSEYQRNLFPRTDTSVRYNGIGYSDVHEDPEVLTSTVLGMGLSTLSPNRAGWQFSIADDFNMGFFERNNHAVSFPEGIGVISDEMVRFVETWGVVGLEFDSASAQKTYCFDSSGKLVYMEYKPLYDDKDLSYTIEVYDDTAAEIDAKIKPYTENLIVGDFSWEDAKAKYTDEAFNIRETSFVNTDTAPISGPVEAAQRAIREYPNLGEYLSIDTAHDDTAGMWRITIESYSSYQASYEYRDIYLDDNGVTHLLVYEGPIEYDQSRK